MGGKGLTHTLASGWVRNCTGAKGSDELVILLSLNFFCLCIALCRSKQVQSGVTTVLLWISVRGRQGNRPCLPPSGGGLQRAIPGDERRAQSGHPLPRSRFLPFGPRGGLQCALSADERGAEGALRAV